MEVSQEGLLAIASGLVAALWGMLTWRIGRGEKNVDRLFKMLDDHSLKDQEVHEKILQEIHDMHIDLLEKIGRHAS